MSDVWWPQFTFWCLKRNFRKLIWKRLNQFFLRHLRAGNMAFGNKFKKNVSMLIVFVWLWSSAQLNYLKQEAFYLGSQFWGASIHLFPHFHAVMSKPSWLQGACGEQRGQRQEDPKDLFPNVASHLLTPSESPGITPLAVQCVNQWESFHNSN